MAEQGVGACGAPRRPDVGVQAGQHPCQQEHLSGLFQKMRDRCLLDLLDAQDDARVRGFDIASVLPEPSVQIAEQVEEHERRIRPVQCLDPVEQVVPRLFVHQLVEMLPQVAPDPLSFLKSHLSPSLSLCFP